MQFITFCLKRKISLAFNKNSAIVLNMNSWKTEVCTIHNGSESWASNALRFATKIEAEKAGHELLSRWYVPISSRAAESIDPVNYVFDDSVGRPVPLSS
jgi:hypothetical protein